MLVVLLLEILVATILSYYSFQLRKTKPQWSTALLIMAVALWGLLIAGFWGWLGG
jgi:hypothetical protein